MDQVVAVKRGLVWLEEEEGANSARSLVTSTLTETATGNEVIMDIGYAVADMRHGLGIGGALEFWAKVGWKMIEMAGSNAETDPNAS